MELYRRYITVFSASLNKQNSFLKVSLCKESAMSQNLNGITHQVNQSYRRKEGNVLFNDALITLYLRLYGIRHMVKDHSDSERGNLLPPHMLPLQAARVILHHYTDRITHTTAFVTPVVGHWLGREIAQWVHHEGSIRRPIAP